MTNSDEKAMVSRVTGIGGRKASFLENATLRMQIEDIGGMIPVFCNVQDRRQINAHWVPWFRPNSEKPYKDAEDGHFWKSDILYNIAGNFPCAPNFGPGHIMNGLTMPAHGWTANLKWTYKKSGLDEGCGAAWVLTEMESPDAAMPLSFKKIDALVPGQSVHYSALSIRNSGGGDTEICCAFHNTLGPPFLEPGCFISAAADTWMTPPPGGEFDETTRLALGAEFPALSKAPLSFGGKTDISVVPSPIGYTDFATGVIPRTARLGWSAVVNPDLKLAYISFFPGPASIADAAGEDEVILYFNDLWMQYGGRPFTPWAPWDGGPDLTYCLGAENSVGAWAYGLDYARSLRRILGSPTTVTIPAGGEKTLYYGCLFAPYEKKILDSGIVGIDMEESELVCKSATEFWKFDADPGFGIIRRIREGLR
ncbi:MAG: hypothetical protein LBO04_07480 [Spirochaetaceae bacterium]|jgi:hypothetical protein|nr:hypothetical protein [Spirochaetaceae bacterium]